MVTIFVGVAAVHLHSSDIPAYDASQPEFGDTAFILPLFLPSRVPWVLWFLRR